MQVWGIGIRILNNDIQKSIDLAGALFRQGYGRPPTHVMLPRDCDLSKVNVYTLQVADHCSDPGSVVVGEACQDKAEPEA